MRAADTPYLLARSRRMLILRLGALRYRSETAEMKERCLHDLAEHPPIAPKEVALAQAKIVELQEKLRKAPGTTP